MIIRPWYVAFGYSQCLCRLSEECAETHLFHCRGASSRPHAVNLQLASSNFWLPIFPPSSLHTFILSLVAKWKSH
jgi:hypothetical protein